MTSYRQLVMRPKERVRIVNLKTFDGTSPNSEEWLFAYGFDSEGNPIFREANLKRDNYKISGSFIGSVEWSPLLRRGISLGSLLGIEESKANQLIRPFAESGAKQLNFVKKHQIYGMFDCYFVTNTWLVFVDKIPTVNYDGFNDKVLKRIKSQWRIYTSRIGQLLRKLEFQKVMGIEE